MSKKVVNLTEDNIPEYIIDTYFPSGSGFNCDYEITELQNTFHIKSSYQCIDEHGGNDGYQDFTIIINKKWRWNFFTLQFNGNRYKADKYTLREYMEDTLMTAFKSVFKDYNFDKEANPIPDYFEALENYGEGIADYLDNPIDPDGPCEVHVTYKGKSYKNTFGTYDEAQYSMDELRKKGITLFAFKPTRVEGVQDGN